MTTRQLPLLIPHRSVYDAASFLPAVSNEEARAWLDRTDVWPDQRLALWGEADRGKTHLLRIWAGRAGAALFNGPSLCGFPAVTLAAAVDNADRADESALLHLLNAARDLGRPVLLIGRRPPSRWSSPLPDLDSRLKATTAVEVGAPDDDLLRRLLSRWLAERQLQADKELYERLLISLPRRPEILLAAVKRLDREALRARRRTISSNMVRHALASGVWGRDLISVK